MLSHLQVILFFILFSVLLCTMWHLTVPVTSQVNISYRLGLNIYCEIMTV